jgi:hypothetical protein
LITLLLSLSTCLFEKNRTESKIEFLAAYHPSLSLTFDKISKNQPTALTATEVHQRNSSVFSKPLHFLLNFMAIDSKILI